MISRFILNLRELYQTTPGSNMRSFSQVRFASSIVGNLGAPLSYDIDGNTDPRILRVSADQAAADPLAAGILFGSEVEPDQ